MASEGRPAAGLVPPSTSARKESRRNAQRYGNDNQGSFGRRQIRLIQGRRRHPVNRLGFGAMRVTGPGIWGPPADRAEALRTLRRPRELGVNFIDTADSYGPDVSED